MSRVLEKHAADPERSTNHLCMAQLQSSHRVVWFGAVSNCSQNCAEDGLKSVGRKD